MSKDSEKRAATISVDSATDSENQLPESVSTFSKYLYNLPWASAAELFLVILTIIGATVLVVCINGKQQWPTSVHVGSIRGRELRMSLITPQTILSISHSVIAFLIGLAVKDGITMAWWRKTLIGGTVKRLDQDYKFGTSLKNALLSGKNINLIAIATIGAAIAAMTQGPLMQRSLTTKIGSADSSINLNTTIAGQIPLGFTGVNVGALGYAGAQFYTKSFLTVMQQYAAGTAITADISQCNGTCSGFIRAAGLVPNCTISTVAYKYNSSVTNTASDSSQGSDVFSVDFGDQVERPNENDVWMMIQLDMFYANLQASILPVNFTPGDEMDCAGTMTSRTCLFRPALIEYPVIITSQATKDTAPNVIVEIDNSFDPWSYTPITYQNLTQVGDIVDGHSGAVTLNGITLALNNVFGSRFTLGPAVSSSPPLILNSAGAVSKYVNATTAQMVELGNTCGVSFLDPSDDIMRAVNEITFRTAVAATNTSTPAVISSAHQTRAVSLYVANPAFWAASLGVTILGILMIIPAFFGWWQLGRKVSLNPIEMAEAFNAPALRQQDTVHKNADHLLELVGDRKVKYVPVDVQKPDGEGVVKRMQMVDVESPAAPVAAADGRAHWVGGWE